jgi:hypothetical protein
MYTEHHHRHTASSNIVALPVIDVQWEVIDTPQGPYEEFRLDTQVQPKLNDVVAFYRYRTDDNNRVQYDLYVECNLQHSDDKLWLIGANLYSKQCELKVLKVLQQESSDVFIATT